MTYSPIPCSIHDHLELACIAKAELRIELRDGTVVVATPITTQVRSDKTEWLLCNNDVEIRLDSLKAFAPSKDKELFARIELP